MTRENIFVGGLLGVALICSGALFAQRPVENIDPHRHPNLAEAQHHILQAFNKVEEARKDTKDEFGGHAEKALQHLAEADGELKQAAEFANKRK